MQVGLPGSLRVARVACEQVDPVYVTLEVTLLQGSCMERTRGGDSIACSSGEGGGDQGDRREFHMNYV